MTGATIPNYLGLVAPLSWGGQKVTHSHTHALCAESAVCGAAGHLSHPPGPRLVVMTPTRDQSTVGRWAGTKAVTDLHCSDRGHSDVFKTAITQN